MKYIRDEKQYEVESITYGGACIQVNGTTITDLAKTGFSNSNGFTVFCDSDEIGFDSFEQAYDFAMTKQKDTFRI